MTFRFLLALSLAVAVTLSGCAVPTLTTMRSNIATSNEYRYEVIQEKVEESHDSTFLAATFSGGGMRAATLAYGALRALRATKVRSAGTMRQDRSVSLIDEFDFVSSVSGGSVTAAYWALHGPDKLDNLEPEFFGQDVEGQLVNRALNPWTLMRLLLPDYSRIDVLRHRFEDLLGDTTYGELLERTETYRDRPYLVINATNMTTGTLFPFAQLHFDLICSDLSVFKIADAVAASAAYPVWFNSLNLKNHRRAEISCLGEGLSKELAKQESKKRKQVDKLAMELNEAHERVEKQQEKLRMAEMEVETKKIAKAKAEALEQVKKLQVVKATTEVKKLAKQHRNAITAVTLFENHLKTAKREHDKSTRERDAEQERKLNRKDKHRNDLQGEQDKIKKLQQELQEARANAREKGTRFADWLGTLMRLDHNLPPQSEDMTRDNEQLDAQRDNRSEAQDVEDTSNSKEEIDGGGSDGRRSHYEDALRKLTKWWKALEETGLRLGEFVFRGESKPSGEEASNQSTATPDEACPVINLTAEKNVLAGQSEEQAPEEEGLALLEPTQTTEVDASERLDEEVCDAQSRAALSMEYAREQMAAVKEKLSRLQVRFGELEQSGVPESADLAGYEELKAELREINDQAAKIDEQWESLENEIFQALPQDVREPTDWETVLKLLAQKTQKTQELHDAVVSELDLESRLEELHWEHAHAVLKNAQGRMAEEEVAVRNGIEVLEAAYAKDQAKADAMLAELQRKVDAARGEVDRLAEELRIARQNRDKLKTELDEHRDEVAERERELTMAKALVETDTTNLSNAERARDDIGDKLEIVRREEEEVARRLKRLRALERERESASDSYKAQLAHYKTEDAKHVHVIDGGAADNLGFTPLLELLDSWFSKDDGSTQTMTPDAENKVSYVGVVAVDARSAPVRDYETFAVSPGVIDTLVATISTAIDSKSSLLARDLGNVTRRLQDDGAVVRRHIVNVGFSDITDFHIHKGSPGIAHVHAVKEISEHADESLHDDTGHSRYVEGKLGRIDLEQCKREFQLIPTTWHLSKTRTEALIAMGEVLVRDSRAYKSLVGDFGGAIPPGSGTVADVCVSHLDKLISERQEVFGGLAGQDR